MKHSKVRIGKHLSDSSPIQDGLKQGDALSSLLFNFPLEYAVRKVKELDFIFTDIHLENKLGSISMQECNFCKSGINDKYWEGAH
jgi:hypothetical protein